MSDERPPTIEELSERLRQAEDTIRAHRAAEAAQRYQALFDAKAGSYVMLSVADTGLGMDKETQARIFEPFFTTKGVGKGTGLGLATVYGIVKQSGGSIWFQSAIGTGTVFNIYLPREAAVVLGTPTRRRGGARATGTETILVVEDEEGVRHLTCRILKAAGYKVLSAANGGEALRVCEERGALVKLVLTDVVMPGMSGRELASRLGGQYPGMKVLYMSGYTDNIIAHRGVLDPGVQLLSKPFSAEDLTSKVREVLDEGPARGS